MVKDHTRTISADVFQNSLVVLDKKIFFALSLYIQSKTDFDPWYHAFEQIKFI